MKISILICLTGVLIRAYGAVDSAHFARIQAEAANGAPEAKLALGEEYLEGRFIAVDEARAVELIRAAADAGLPAAQFELAEMYACGMGEPRHEGETPFRLYRLAGDKGHRGAMAQLARRYRLGLGTERDLLEAARWLARTAAETVSPVRDFLNDRGEPRPQLAPEDRPLAGFLALYLRARRNADPATMLQVGRAFLAGENGKPNFVTAAFWLGYSARRGNAEADKLAEQARAKLTPEQSRRVDLEITNFEAERQAREGNPQPQK